MLPADPTRARATEAGTRADWVPEPPAVAWPERHHPSTAVDFAQGECVIAAAPEVVWSWLVRAALWHTWLPGTSAVHFLSHAAPDLRDRSRFRIGGPVFRLTCKVREFVPGRRLAWDAHAPGLDGYRAWVLTPLPDGSTHVLAEETRTGWLTRLLATLRPGSLSRANQSWLEALAGQVNEARGGPPPARSPTDV